MSLIIAIREECPDRVPAVPGRRELIMGTRDHMWRALGLIDKIGPTGRILFIV